MARITKNDGTATIYGLVDPRTGELRYVGSTTLPVNQRLTSHMRDHDNKSPSPKEVWIRGLKEQGLRPQVVEIESCSVEYRDDRELFWIRHYQDSGCSLVNVVGLYVPLKTTETPVDAPQTTLEGRREFARKYMADIVNQARILRAKTLREERSSAKTANADKTESCLKLIGAAVRMERDKQGITRAGLAKRCAVNWETLRRMEQGENTTLTVLVDVVNALGVRFSDIFDGIDNAA
jgi:DNA-binding XRE family transcriptional regulator